MVPFIQIEFKNVRKFFIRILSIVFILSLYGCGKKHPHQLPDGPPKKIPANILRTPDPIPKVEPLSKYGNRFKKGTTNVYVTKKRRYHVLSTSKGYRARGKASWYGTKFHGRKTSSGEPYNMFAMTAAHTTLPLPSYIKVTNLHNGKHVILKVNDRGPFHNNRLIDVSYLAAAKLGILGHGTADVEIESVDPRDHGGRIPRYKSSVLATQQNKIQAKNSTIQNTKPALYLQVGSFKDRIKAEALAKKIAAFSQAKTYVAQTQKSQSKTDKLNTSNSLTHYQVRIGPMKDNEEMQQLTKALSKAKLPLAKVIRELP